MTIASIISDFRTQARDMVTPPRYRDPLCLQWYNEAVRAVYMKRPEAYPGISFVDDSITVASSTSDTFLFVDYFRKAVVLYMQYCAGLYDRDQKRAEYFRQLFNTELKT